MDKELTSGDFVKVVVEELKPIPPNDNPFLHDQFNMGTSLTRGWVVMHEGFDRPEDPLPLHYLILVNTRTGQRLKVVFKPK